MNGKTCAVCGKHADEGALQCPHCGAGTFATEKTYRISSRGELAGSDMTRPAERTWLSRLLGKGRRAPASGSATGPRLTTRSHRGDPTPSARTHSAIGDVRVEDYIQGCAPGTAIWALSRVSDTRAEAEPAFLIREDDNHLAALRRGFELSSASCVLLQDGVLLVPMMLSIHGGRLYEAWFNYHRVPPEDLKADASAFAHSDSLHLAFYSARGRQLRAPISNPFKRAFAELLRRIDDYGPWSMGQFDAATAKVCETLPTVDDLWEYILGSSDIFRVLR
jgi:hypothetical protein